jgi:hypothetical protein
VIDGTLFNYMMLDFDGAWKMIKRLIDEVARLSGVFTILWHNTEMMGNRLKLYKKVLEYAYENDAWMTSGKEISKWWRKKQI